MPNTRACAPHSPCLLTLSGDAVPRVIVGTDRLGSVLNELLGLAGDSTRAYRYLDAVFELGCTAFDTAASYQLGGAERLLGQWLRSRRNRDRLFLISKGGHPSPPLRPNRLTPRDLRADLHDSLRRLQTEHIDLYLLHRDSQAVSLLPILETLVGFQQEGKIGAFGVSNWSHERLAALDTLADAAQLPTVAASSPHFSLVEWVQTPWPGTLSIAGPSQRPARAYYEKRQLPVLAWSPLGRGFFSPTASVKEADRVYGSVANAARRQRAHRMAARYQCTAAQIALAYVFSHAFPVYAVVSSSTVANMKLNLKAAALRLSAREVQWLEGRDNQPPP